MIYAICIHNIYLIYIICIIWAIMKVKKTFLPKTFRRKSSTVKIFCSDIHYIYIYIYMHIYMYVYI